MEYRELLAKIAEFGMGVFTITMLDDLKQRRNLAKFIRDRPELFLEIKGSQGDVKLCVLNKAGYNYFNFKGTPTRSETPAGIRDVALFNSYMVEIGSYSKCKNKPHEILSVADRSIGLVSNRWGICQSIREIDLLLGTPLAIQKYLNDFELISSAAKSCRCSIDEIKVKLQEAYTPIAFQNLRESP